jgi:pimeloyl-ACP methyl ester carboxylesterase
MLFRQWPNTPPVAVKINNEPLAVHSQRSIRVVESSLLHRVATRLVVFIVCATIATPLTCCWAFQTCTLDLGGGICPDGNTCCRKTDGSSGCIASDMGKYNATCCTDGDETTRSNDTTTTTASVSGCGVGYKCRRIQGDCIATDQSPLGDPLVKILPRYHLCQTEHIRHVHGLSINSSHSNQAEQQAVGQLAYYSSHGPIDTLSPSSLIDYVLIVIHGANRNADDYFCAATGAVQLQKTLYGYQNVLVVAPHFLGSSDSVVKGRQQQKLEDDEPSFLFWKDEGAGPWRYGADAMGPTPISSYTVLDTLVATILQALGSNDRTRITMAGHSSGGQMMQRWSLLTTTWDASRMRAVIANPSSFAYLTPLRYIYGRWQQPVLGNDGDKNSCTQYNQWEWGLDPGGPLDVPYRRNVISNVSTLIGRLQHRSVTYLAGSADRCNVSDEKGGWCHSHGLEMSCMDMLQGANRWERSARYYSSLRLLGIWKHHHRQFVKGVGHDHTLMFQSPVGLEALFGEEKNHDASFVRSYFLRTVMFPKSDWK